MAKYIGRNEGIEIHYEFQERRYWILNECQIILLDFPITTHVCERCMTMEVDNHKCDVCRGEKKYPYLIMKFQIIQGGTTLKARITNQFMLKKLLMNVTTLEELDTFDRGDSGIFRTLDVRARSIDFTQYTSLALTCTIINSLYCNFEIVKLY